MALLIQVQYCKNCALHSWCSHHDEVKYIDFYEQLTKKISQQFPYAKIIERKPSDQLVLRKIQSNDGALYINKQTGQPVHFPRLGSFEIYVDGVRIFSKIKSKLWPKFDSIMEKLKNINKAKDQGRSLIAFDIDQVQTARIIRNQDKYDIRAIFRVRKTSSKDQQNYMHQTSGRQGFRQRDLQRSLDVNKQVNEFNPQKQIMVFEQADQKNEKETKKWLQKWNLGQPSQRNREQKANIYLQELYPRTQNKRRKLVISKIDSKRILLQNQKGQRNIYRKQSQKEDSDRTVLDSAASDPRASSRRNTRRKLAPIPPLETNAKINSFDKKTKDQKYEDLYDELNLSEQERQKLQNKPKQVGNQKQGEGKRKNEEKEEKILENEEYEEQYQEQDQYEKIRMEEDKKEQKELKEQKEQKQQKQQKEQKDQTEQKDEKNNKNKIKSEKAEQQVEQGVKMDKKQQENDEQKYSNEFLEEQVEENEREMKKQSSKEKDVQQEKALEVEDLEEQVKNIQIDQKEKQEQEIEQEKEKDQHKGSSMGTQSNKLDQEQISLLKQGEKEKEADNVLQKKEQKSIFDELSVGEYQCMRWNAKIIQGQFHLIVYQDVVKKTQNATHNQKEQEKQVINEENYDEQKQQVVNKHQFQPESNNQKSIQQFQIKEQVLQNKQQQINQKAQSIKQQNIKIENNISQQKFEQKVEGNQSLKEKVKGGKVQGNKDGKTEEKKDEANKGGKVEEKKMEEKKMEEKKMEDNEPLEEAQQKKIEGNERLQDKMEVEEKVEQKVEQSKVKENEGLEQAEQKIEGIDKIERKQGQSGIELNDEIEIKQWETMVKGEEYIILEKGTQQKEERVQQKEEVKNAFRQAVQKGGQWLGVYQKGQYKLLKQQQTQIPLA